MAKLYHEFDQEELAAIYRLLHPGATYLGDQPEAWDMLTLHSAIRATVVEKYGVDTRAGRHSALRRYR